MIQISNHFGLKGSYSESTFSNLFNLSSLYINLFEHHLVDIVRNQSSLDINICVADNLDLAQFHVAIKNAIYKYGNERDFRNFKKIDKLKPLNN